MRYEHTNTDIPDTTLKARKEALQDYRAHIAACISKRDYDVPEASVVVPFDPAHIAAAERICEAIGPVRHVVLIGIGGSSAGTAAVYGALRTDATPALHVLDVLDANHVMRVITELKHVPLQDFAIVIGSKSGSTTETLANAEVCVTQLAAVFGVEIYGRIVCIGDEGTRFAHYAADRSMHFAAIPQRVGGRYSVFTTVGLVPLALLGFDIRMLIAGAAHALARENCGDELEKSVAALHEFLAQPDAPSPAVLTDSEWVDTAATSAAVMVSMAEKGAMIEILFAQDERLLGFAAWYQQLLAESLGKHETIDGGEAPHTLAPFTMTPRELHSTAQLYFSGFPGVYTHFFRADASKAAGDVSDRECGTLIPVVGDRSYARMATAITDGVLAAYREARMPHATLDVGELSAYVMGGALAQKMLEVMYAAHLMRVNAFDQPHVEVYKKEVRTILGRAD